jgi:hypothetical protein
VTRNPFEDFHLPGLPPQKPRSVVECVYEEPTSQGTTTWYTASDLWFDVLKMPARHMIVAVPGAMGFGRLIDGAKDCCVELAKLGFLKAVWGLDKFALPRGMTGGQAATIIMLSERVRIEGVHGKLKKAKFPR